jgi:hypothetical protein
MSLAKVNRIGRVRNPGTCEKCGLEIKKGDPAVRFAVGFRGYTRTRCTKPECFPKPSERESSLVADVYAAQEEVDVDSAETLEELEQIRDDVATATREVAGQYEDSEMFDKNPDLQERAEQLNSAADELDNWQPEGDDEPEEDNEETWSYNGHDFDTYEAAHDEWLLHARLSLSGAIDGMELP